MLTLSRFNGKVCSVSGDKTKATFYLKPDNLKRIQHEAIDRDKSQGEILDEIIEAHYADK